MIPPAARSQVERIELAPNSSLSPRDAALFFGTLGFVTLAIAVFFVAQGYWPVLPFAGLELVVLFWALAASMRRRHCRERILVSDDEVAIETQFRGELTRVVFSRHWARIRLRAPFYALHPSRLTIESHGRSVEIGGFLNEEERRRLALRLRRLVGPNSESPAPAAAARA
ncbi:MAG TPA: DUF2244 domain-containing protein [Steroidobacteraceae bacterium]|nr:DUF2244 domain-containing protein [Steroidobacteraceae bacterium]